MLSIVEEYFSSGDIADVAESLEDLGAPVCGRFALLTNWLLITSTEHVAACLTSGCFDCFSPNGHGWDVRYIAHMVAV